MPKKAFKQRTDAKQNKRLDALEKMVNSVVETKLCRSLTQEQLVSTSPGGLSGFISIPIGSANGQRSGNKVQLMSTQYRLFVRQNEGAAADLYNVARCLIIESKDGSQSLTWNDVVRLLPSGSVNIYSALNSGYQTDIETNKNYRVIFDSGAFNMAFNAAKQTKAINFTRKYGKAGKTLIFDPDGTTPTNFKQTIVWMSDSAATPHPVIVCDVNNRYKDA